MKTHENSRNTMRVIRGQEASLESSKGFYRGSRSAHTVLTTHASKSMEIDENQ